MPITPAHLGPTLAISLIFERYLDVVVFFVASLIIDIEPVLYFLLGIKVPVYFSHTFLIGGVIGIITAYVIHGLRLISLRAWPFFYPILNWHPEKEVGRVKFLASGILGVWSHIIIDSLVPWGIFTLDQVYFLCLLLFILAVVIGIRFMFKRSAKQESVVIGEGYDVL